MLIEYKEIIDKELRLFSDKLPSLSIYDPIKYIISNGGKRFRSSLTLMAADLFSNQPLLAINEAIAIDKRAPQLWGLFSRHFIQNSISMPHQRD